ncbi:MAG: alpha/beta hydrolase domain-containing protein [Acidobacteriota bacterium]
MVWRALFVSLLAAAAAGGGVVRIEIHDRGDAPGAYERLAGRVYFAVDPALAANRIITDIDLAPRNAEGKVEFSADFYILKPRDSGKGNGTVLYEVSNRGGKGMLRMFNLAETQFGDGFLMEQGYTLLWLGWQFDVPDQPQLLRLFAPPARGKDGPITGLVRSEHVPDRTALSFSLADRTMIAYPVLEPESAELTVRDRVEGARRVIPRSQWQFAREENGQPVPDRTRVFMPAGFEPGKIYEVVYKAQDPALVGLGPAAVRDLISFLKYGGTPQQGILPLSGERRFLKRAIGFGVSQSGRFLRTFTYYGFNQDEKGRPVFDGLMVHVAGGGRGSFNHRFAQPSRDAHPFMNMFYPTDIFPFTDLDQTDPETSLTDGLLARAEKAGVTPKIFYTNSSCEYYGRAASLIHTTLDGGQDAPPAKDTRVYLFAGSQHGPAGFPPPRSGTQNPTNPNDFRWSMRALLAAMNRWLASGQEPPASQYPRVAEQQLVPLEAVRFPKIPGVALPTIMHKAYRVDYGPQFRGAGIVSFEPPKVGKAFAMLVPQVDADGNETSGIRMPDVQAPLAAYTGWNLRDPKLGAPDELHSMAGSWLPFPRTKISQRYKSRAEYLEKATAAARELARQGYLLEGDVTRIVEQAGRQWDYLMRQGQPR